MVTTPLVLGSYGEQLDLEIKQGCMFGPHTFSLKNPDSSPVNLAGCSFRAQMRRKALDPEKVLDFTCVVTNAAGGVFQMSLTAAQTADIRTGEVVETPDSKFVWDMEMVDSLGGITPRYYGNVSVFREVTRD